MLAPYVLAQVAAVLNDHGETMTLRRAGQANLDVKAKRYSAAGVEIAGSMQDQALVIKISNAEIAASAAPNQAPRRGDTIGGFVIQECDTRKLGATVVLHILRVGGSG
jgi:hypothetical protein